jgi:hypothetical protein
MADLTVTVPDAFVSRLVDPVAARAAAIEGWPVTQKILTAWGETDVVSLTAIQKAELIALVHLWQLVQLWGRENVGEIAADAAVAAHDQDVLDDFNP